MSLGGITDQFIERSLIGGTVGSAFSALCFSDIVPVPGVPELLSPLGLVICVSAVRVHFVREGSVLCGIISDPGVML